MLLPLFIRLIDRFGPSTTFGGLLREARPTKPVIFGGGACPSIESIFASKHAHVGALCIQIFMEGEIDEGSSKVPMRTTVNCGLADELANKCEPHAGQKRRRIWLPLAATLVNSLSSPLW